MSWLRDLSTIVGLLIQTLLALKLYEMLVHCLRALTTTFAATATSGERSGWSRAVWPVTGILVALPLPAIVRRLVLRILFRWTSLMLLTGVVVITSPEPRVIIAGLSLLIAGIWLQILQRFVFRIRFGRGDTGFRFSAARALGRAASGAHGHAALDESVDVEDFVRLFARLSVVTVLCYASVYCGLRNLTPDKEVFHGIVLGVDGNIGLLYFSTVTMATVGYGDIYPVTTLARVLVASQICAVFFLFVLLASAFALTASATETPPRQPAQMNDGGWKEPTEADPDMPRPAGVRHLGIIPDGNRSCASREGVSVRASYDAAAARLGECLRHAFGTHDLASVTLYLLSARNTRRNASELAAFLASGLAFGERILPQILEEYNVGLKLVWMDTCEQALREKTDPALCSAFVTAYRALADATAKRRRSLYALLAYDPFEEVRRAVEAGIPSSALSIDHLSVPVELDLIVRTGSHTRLSRFVPLQSGEAELVFVPKPFPDFRAADLDEAVAIFKSAKRNFGL